MERNEKHPRQGRDVGEPLSEPKPKPMLKPTIVNMTVSTTKTDTARAVRRKDRHRSSLPMPKDKRITATGKAKNDMVPTMLWIVPTIVASPPTSIGKIAAISSETP
jgi:hypothetical protein